MTNYWLNGPILFLDIDGVLNSIRYAKKRYEAGHRDSTLGIDPDTIPYLQRIIDETNCTLVLSSTWRLLHSLSDMRGILIAAGLHSPVPLKDRTPCISKAVGSIEYTKGRGYEIQAWIDLKKYESIYCCLDDDSDFLPHQPLVRTAYEVGLTNFEADRCIAILKGEKP